MTEKRPQNCGTGYCSCIECPYEAEQAEQEPFDMDDHPPHRLCECRKCMEYFTPLPDCDAFAAPVRTKDLTDDEIVAAWNKVTDDNCVGISVGQLEFARAVIAADREKNRAG